MRRIISAFLIIFIIITVLPTVAFADENDDIPEEELFSVGSPFAAIINADTGTELYSKNADMPLFCAFLPRIMTCIMLVESGLDLQTEILITKEMMAVSHEKSSANLVSGDRISLYDLMKCIILT